MIYIICAALGIQEPTFPKINTIYSNNLEHFCFQTPNTKTHILSSSYQFNMQLSTIYITAVSLLLPAVYANPWGNPLLKARDIPTCVDGSGSGCDGGDYGSMGSCEDQCYGAEADSGDL